MIQFFGRYGCDSDSLRSAGGALLDLVQLSFAAVLAIIYAFERLERRVTPAASLADDDRAARIRRGLAAFFGVSLAATWGTLPLGMYYFNNVTFIGLLANCIAIPLMGYLVVAIGLAGAFILGRFLGSIMARLAGPDPLAIGGVAVLLLSVALFACWMPARRAAKVDPMIALRAE